MAFDIDPEKRSHINMNIKRSFFLYSYWIFFTKPSKIFNNTLLYEDDGRIYIQPLIKSEQNEIIIAFQDIAYKVFGELINEQLQESKK